MDLLHKTAQYNFVVQALSGAIEAYHCGRDLVGGSFSLNHLGSGEGMLYLGPGIYFTTSKNLALQYVSYAEEPFLYKVLIQSNGLYDPARGEPLNLREQSINLQEKLCEQFNLPKNKHLLPTDTFSYGKEYIGFMVQKLGREKTRQMLKEVGISGIYENLSSGPIEICVFDPSIITLIEKEKITK